MESLDLLALGLVWAGAEGEEVGKGVKVFYIVELLAVARDRSYLWVFC